MASTYSIHSLKLPNGDIVNLVDDTSGYITSAALPSVYDAALKLQKDSETAIDLFTANRSVSATLKWTTSTFKTVSS